MFKMAILNIILLGSNFFFLIYEKKIYNRLSEAKPKFYGASFASQVRALRAEKPTRR